MGGSMRVGGVIIAALAIFAVASCRAEPANGREDPRPTMDRIFEAISQLLPASLDQQRFADPAGRDTLLHWMDVLVDSAGELREHASGRDPGFEFLAMSLVSDVRQIRRRYSRGRYEESRFFLGHLTETCVACHSRLPSADFPLAEKLLASIDLSQLTPTEKTRLQVATRQFDAALVTFEAIFRDPAVLPAHMDMSGYFVDYLSTVLRVKQDLARASRALSGVLARADTSHYLKRNLRTWIRSLDTLAAQGEQEVSLERGRVLIAKAQSLNEFAADQEGLVYNLMASSVLHRYVDGVAEPGPKLAEAYYLLGVADAGSRRTFWVSQAEFYFETAIRADPKSATAEKAYALLEEYIVLGYSGSSGVHIPPDVQATLDSLRALIEEGS